MTKYDNPGEMDSPQQPDEKQKTLVLLIDSDGTIFKGNMKNVISAIIRFLKKPHQDRVSIKLLLEGLGKDLPPEMRGVLKSWLEKQETIPWTTPDSELLILQHTIAGFFPLIQYQDPQAEEKSTYTAIDIFKAILEKKGRVMVLTFNSFAPETIRYNLVKNGLSPEHAQRINIICPGVNITISNQGIFACETPGDGEAVNKNKYIQTAYGLCQNEFKLGECRYIFADDQHYQAADRLVKKMDIKIITGEYTQGQHLKAMISLINGQTLSSSISKYSSPTSSPIWTQKEGDDSTPELKLRIMGTGSRSPSLNLRSSLSTPSKHPRKMSNLELPPVFGSSPSRRSSVLLDQSFSAPHSSSSQNSSSRRQLITDFDLPTTTIEEPSLASENSDSSASTITTLTYSGAARHEQLPPNLNQLPPALEQNPRSSLEIPEEDEEVQSLMYPQSLTKKAISTYDRVETLDDKLKLIINAITLFYPKNSNTRGGTIALFKNTNPEGNLSEWIKKLDDLFNANEQKPKTQLKIATAAITCWTTLQLPSFEEEKTKKSQIVRKKTFSFLSNPTSSPPLMPLSAAELQKWRLRKSSLNLDVSEPAASSKCCLIQ